MTRTLWPQIMLTGKNGQVGWELQRTLTPLGEVVALDRQRLDLADPDQIRARVREIKPSLIVNAAAYTAVDRAEEEPELATAVNGTAPGILAEEAKHLNAAIIHYSTDYVFDGTKTTPYTEEDAPNPINVYGKTKLAGEQAVQAVGVPHLILRTSWIYGLRGKNFLLTILRLAREREELKIVNDQIGAPTWSRTIAEVTAEILKANTSSVMDSSGIYHLTASGSTSWYGFAKAILKLDSDRAEQVCRQLKPILTAEYPTPARRPTHSVLSNAKLKAAFGIALPDWEQSLKLTLREGPR
ncbi:dTDP-4-dehydrorhamnose reductase [Thermodesulfovibrionales bacterium]|nr:dTDP-4-dehydrorhamnose reductase [Thermodesulfovibrionales bacterium]